MTKIMTGIAPLVEQKMARAIGLAALGAILALAPAEAREAPLPTLSEARGILSDVDRLRLPVPEGSLHATLTLMAGNLEAPPIPFDIRFSSKGARLIEALAGSRKGQKVLLSDEGYWLAMPGTTKPVRLTQVQRMIGPASFGDIGRIRLASDYDVCAVEPDASGGALLKLAARSDRVTFSRVTVDVDAARRPLGMTLYYPSGKVLRIVAFDAPETVGGHAMIARMWISDPIDPGHRAVVRYSDLAATEMAESLFDPTQLESEP